MKKAFTIVEILTVVAIIGVLSTIVIVNLGSAQARSRDAKRMSDLDTVRSALLLYKTEHKVFPGPASGSQWDQFSGWDATYKGSKPPYCWCQEMNPANFTDTFTGPTSAGLYEELVVKSNLLSALPIDPKNREKSGNFLGGGASGGDFGYIYRFVGGTATLGTNLEVGGGTNSVVGNKQIVLN